MRQAPRKKLGDRLVGTYALDVCGRPYEVRFLEGDAQSGNKIVAGSCDPWKHIIEVGGKACRPEQRATLLHEIIHACYAVYGGDISTEEQSVTTLEAGLYQVLRSPTNEWFVAFLLEPDKKGAK